MQLAPRGLDERRGDIGQAHPVELEGRDGQLECRELEGARVDVANGAARSGPHRAADWIEMFRAQDPAPPRVRADSTVTR